MAYPYKKMTEEDFEYIRSVTSFDRVWTGKILQQNTTGMKCRNMACFLLNFMSKSSTKKRFLPLWPMHTKKIFLSYAAVPSSAISSPWNFLL